jgi:hypothetical protein
MREGSKRHSSAPDLVAGNSLLDPRALLRSGVAIAGAMGAVRGSETTGAAAEPLEDAWSLEPSSSVKSYLTPCRFTDGTTQRHRSPVRTAKLVGGSKAERRVGRACREVKA